jgi:hypothetical protein
MSNFYRRPTVLAATAALAVAAFEVSQSALASPSSTQRPSASTLVQQPRSSASSAPRLSHKHRAHHAISRGLTRHFSVFGLARSASTQQAVALPVNIQQTLEQPTEYELEPAQAQFVTLDANTHAWLVPGRRGLCVIVPASVDGSEVGNIPSSSSGPVGGGEVCAAAGKAVDGEVLMRQINPASGEGVVVGLAPDNASITLIDKNGGTTRAQVTGNLYTTRDQSLAAVRVALANGTSKTISFPQP